MPIKKYLNRVEQFDQLVRAERTGAPHEIAEKLGFSEATFYTLVDELRDDFGFPIEYSRKRQTYYYTEVGRMETLCYKKYLGNNIHCCIFGVNARNIVLSPATNTIMTPGTALIPPTLFNLLLAVAAGGLLALGWPPATSFYLLLFAWVPLLFMTHNKYG